MDTVILFGQGRYFIEKKEALFSKYEIREIWDSSIEKGTKGVTENIPVINPADADKDSTDIILLLSVRFIGMWKSLIKLGVDPQRIQVPYELPRLFENDEAINKCVNRIEFTLDEVVVTTNSEEVFSIHDENEWRELLRLFYKRAYPIVDAISMMSTTPVSEQFATERGTPIDRYYIERFLEQNKKYIKGSVLEIEDSSYTLRFGGGECSPIVMDVTDSSDQVDYVANLETGEGIPEQIADCFICTQTLMYLYDLKTTVDNIYKLLKPGGVVLLTCSGISQNSRRCMDNFGCTYNFNTDAFRNMFDDAERFEILSIGSFGNVKTVCAHLAGLCQEDLSADDFVPNDKYYPLIAYAVVKRVN